MNDEHGFPIQWSQPHFDGATPAWDGPAPHDESARVATPPAAESAAQRGGLASAWVAAAAPSTDGPASASSASPDSAPHSTPGTPAEPPEQISGGSHESASQLEVAAQPSVSTDDAASAASALAAPDAPAAVAVNVTDSAPGGAASDVRSSHDAAPAHDMGYRTAPSADAHDGAASQRALHDEPQHDVPAPAPHADNVASDQAADQVATIDGPPEVIGNNDELPDDQLTIGRSRENSIVLDDMLVSRRHVVIIADDEGLLLRDVGSRNGTYVNGRKVEQIHLHEGDRIGIGASTFEVRDGWLVSL